MKLSNQIINFGEFMYRVYPYTKVEDLQEGNAYTFGFTAPGGFIARLNYVLPYRGKRPTQIHDPGIYLDNGELFVARPRTDKERRTYNVDRIFSITPETINSSLIQHLKDVDTMDLKASETFRPKITEHDDLGMKALRIAIWMKQLDFNIYSPRWPKVSDKANARKHLEHQTRLTFNKLDEYANVFDLGVGMIFFDKKGARDPLSPEGKAIVVFDDDVYPINDPNIMIINDVNDIMGEDGE